MPRTTTRTSTRATALLGIGATIALLAMLLLWQQVDGDACRDAHLDLAACATPRDVEQA